MFRLSASRRHCLHYVSRWPSVKIECDLPDFVEITGTCGASPETVGVLADVQTHA